jgi:hypothetical protein
MLTILGLVLAFNILVIYAKLTHNRLADGLLDAGLLTLVTYVFSNSTDALIIGTIASAVISIFLYFSPPKIFQEEKEEEPPKPRYNFR